MSWPLPSRLYAIADPEVGGREVVAIVDDLLAGGARVVQLRCKSLAAGAFVDAALRSSERTRRHAGILVVNDRLDVALAAGADGVHLGQSDLPVAEARRLVEATAPERAGSFRIGVSTHDLAQARTAAREGADYVGFGPLFGTATKATGYSARGLDALRAVRAAIAIPIVAIGGVTLDNARDAIAAGADSVAMISALLAAPDVAARTRDALARLT